VVYSVTGSEIFQHAYKLTPVNRPGYPNPSMQLRCLRRARYVLHRWLRRSNRLPSLAVVRGLHERVVRPPVAFGQNQVSARWHRGHLGFCRPCFCNDRFCQRADAVNNLLRIEAALAGELLPVPPLRSSPDSYGYRLGEVLGDVFQTTPHMTSYIGASDAPLPRIIIE